MDANSEYYQQLQAINSKLEQVPEGPERDELINLKQNIEELLLLTGDSEGPLNSGEGSSGVAQENKKNDTVTTDDPLEDEYALFMAEMTKEGAVEKGIENNDKNQPTESDMIEKLKELEGKKFRAPHKHQWGQLAYHNAMVCSVPKDILDINKLQVKVLFLNPTHKEMLPCPYYFDMEKDCLFSEEQCRFSHGELVDYSSLQDYIEPKFENLTVASEVLAKQSDDLWYRGKITQISKGKCLVKFESKNVQNVNYEEIIFEHILPLERSENGSDDDSASDSDPQVIKISDDEESMLESRKRHQDLINKSLMITPDSVPLGDWEKYTKGIGSKLMQRMGYIVGTGLGKEGNGIIKPVTALILPQGKSLDFCMNLKEERQNPDLFHADNVTKGGKWKEKKWMLKAQEKKAKKKLKIENMNLGQYIHWCSSRTMFTIDQINSNIFKDKLKVANLNNVNVANFVIDRHIQKKTKNEEKIKAQIRHLEDKHQEPKTLYKKLQHTKQVLKLFSDFGLLVKNELERRKNNKEMAVF